MQARKITNNKQAAAELGIELAALAKQFPVEIGKLSYDDTIVWPQNDPSHRWTRINSTRPVKMKPTKPNSYEIKRAIILMFCSALTMFGGVWLNRPFWPFLTLLSLSFMVVSLFYFVLWSNRTE